LIFRPDDLDEIITLLKNIQPDFIFYGSDIFIETADTIANKVCPKFSNPVYSSRCRENKNIINTTLAANGFKVPKEIVINSLNDFLPHRIMYPVVIKPCENSGAGFGVKQCMNEQDIIEYLAEHSYQCVIQEVIWDKEDPDLQISYSVDGFVLNGEFTFISLQKYYKKKIDNTFIILYVEQLDSMDTFSKNIFNQIGKMLRALELNNGFFHSEVIKYNDDLVLIDLNPRISGADGIVDKMIELSFGYGVIQCFINKVYNKFVQPILKMNSRLILLYNLSNEKFNHVKSLLSFKEQVFNDILYCNIILLGNYDIAQLSKDFNFCKSLNEF
jgi:hypothetical protein